MIFGKLRNACNMCHNRLVLIENIWWAKKSIFDKTRRWYIMKKKKFNYRIRNRVVSIKFQE